MSESNGPIIAPPKNIGEMEQLARDLYGTGKKNMAIGAICDCIKLLSAGVRRGISDYHDLESRHVKLVEESNELKRRLSKLEEIQRQQ